MRNRFASKRIRGSNTKPLTMLPDGTHRTVSKEKLLARGFTGLFNGVHYWRGMQWSGPSNTVGMKALRKSALG